MTETVNIGIEAPRRLKGVTLAGERVPLGSPGDYKPCVAELPDGRLLLVAFSLTRVGRTVRTREEILLYRSDDGGRTWSRPENLTTQHDLRGREPYFTILADGTIFITVHSHIMDVRNTTGYFCSYLHRSDDGGSTWSTTSCDPPDARGEDGCTTRTIMELQDGSLLVGTSGRGHDRSFIWRSYDRGKTWPEKYRCKVEGLDASYPHNFLGEGFWWQAHSGKVYLTQRVDSHFAVKQFGDDHSHIEAKTDQYDRMVLYETTDAGRTLKPVRPLGHMGEMFPSILRLRDGRLLFTFTVRTRVPPLGVRAVVGRETDDDFEFDFAN